MSVLSFFVCDNSAQKYDDIREELVTSVNLEELGPLMTELKKRRDSGDDGCQGLEQIPPPWTCDKSRVELALCKLTPEYHFWRQAICYPRGPLNRKPHGDTGGWISIVGIGSRTMSPGALQALKESTSTRAWACRHAVVCLDVPDDALYKHVTETHRVDLFYREKPEDETEKKMEEKPASEPPKKIQRGDECNE